MIHAQNEKKVRCINPVSINTGAATSIVIDTRPDGVMYDYVEILVGFGVVGGAATVLRVQESDVATDTTTLSSGADVVGTVSAGATGNLRLPQTADANSIMRLYRIDMRKGRKRYLQVQATVGATTIIYADAFLSRASQTPVDASGAGTTVYA